MTTKKPSKAKAAESTTPAEPAAAAPDPVVPTENVPGAIKPVYKTGVGKRAYEVASDPALFLRYGVVGVAALGLLYTLFSVLSVRAAGVSTILSTLFFSLLVTLVATGVLYALRNVVEQTGDSD